MQIFSSLFKVLCHLQIICSLSRCISSSENVHVFSLALLMLYLFISPVVSFNLHVIKTKVTLMSTTYKTSNKRFALDFVISLIINIKGKRKETRQKISIIIYLYISVAKQKRCGMIASRTSIHQFKK